MQLKEIEKLAASVMERAVDAKEVAGVNLLVLKDKAPVLSLQAGYADLGNKILMAEERQATATESSALRITARLQQPA